MAAIGLPQPPIPQRGEKNAQLAPAPGCHNPRNDNARGPGIAMTPDPTTHAAPRQRI